MLYSFKQKSQDFIVEEKLPFKFSNKGDAFFVFFEKRNKTTMEIINWLCKELKISRKNIWIAWLKDKTAITKQYLSIYKSILEKIWGIKFFLKVLWEKAKILTTNWHEKPINLTTEIKNEFFIRLRAKQKISQNLKTKLQTEITKLFEEWFPNFYWSQRFGVNYRNINIWKDILFYWKSKEIKKDKVFETKFKVQAYLSYLFNKYLVLRLKDWLQFLEWDIVEYNWTLYNATKDFIYYEKILENPKKYLTWPILWYDLMLPAKNTKAWEFEYNFIKSYNIWPKQRNYFKKNKIRGIRRKLRVYLDKYNFKFDEDDILLNFTLPKWTYASVLIERILKIIEQYSK